jgi:hypothetical protein
MRIMRVEEFSNELFDELKHELSKITERRGTIMETSRQSSTIMLKYINRLKKYINNYQFQDIPEEINFFKNIKPKFLSKLIYFQKVYKIQFHLPLGYSEMVKNYYLKELEKINDFFKINGELFSYCRSGATSLDEIYFTRKELDSWILLNSEDYETDFLFTTIYDQKLAKILAFKLVSEFLKSEIKKLEISNKDADEGELEKGNQIHWTGPKVALVELLYALQSAGSFNNGTVDLKELANHFQSYFNVDLGNYYRTFQDMRIRKINRTTFLDLLKGRLIQRMDETDENPKY